MLKNFPLVANEWECKMVMPMKVMTYSRIQSKKYRITSDYPVFDMCFG